MDTDSGSRSWFHKHRGVILIAGVTAAIVLWWLFRPEALFIDRQVSETAPADVAEIEPVFTGSLHTVGTAAPTTGRVNILKKGAGFQLEIPNLETQAAGPFTVGIAAADIDPQPARLGTVSAAGHEKLALPGGLNPDGHRIVLLMDHANQVVAKATLESF